MRLWILAWLLFPTAWLAGVEQKPLLHPLFSDGAVLQRGKPVMIWGWSAPHAAVRVSLSGTRPALPSATVEATETGRWSVALDAVESGSPCALAVESDGRQATARDLLIGDVWLCAGQSNMEFPAEKARDFSKEKAGADLPLIRHFTVARRFSPEPEALVGGSWVACTPQTVGRFTAVGFFMARRLHQDLQVPIGILHSSWGGTDAESWVGRETLAALPEQRQALDDWNGLIARVDEQDKAGKTYAQLLREWFRANDPGTAAEPAWSDPACDDAGWKTVRLPGMLDDQAVPKDWDGTLWLRRTFTVPEASAGKPAKLLLGRINGQDTTWIDGRQVGEAEGWVQRSYALQPAVVKPGTHTLAIRLLNKSGPIGLAERIALAIGDGADVPLDGAWRCKIGAPLGKAPLPYRFSHRNPTVLANGMIAPLAPFQVRGVAWYQGENNTERAYQYRTLLPALVRDWRARFTDERLPFLVVSLANYRERKPEPGDSAWAELREAQAAAVRQVGDAGLAVAIDVGDAGDIHPTNKQEVGRRLALAAESVAYGRAVEWSGPWYAGMTVEGASIRLRFDHADGLAVRDGGALTGFAIAGADRKFVWAEARIDGGTVVVSSPAVAEPVAVRYAWASNPACNLTNRSGLPAVPFRTDDWPGLTWPKP